MHATKLIVDPAYFRKSFLTTDLLALPDKACSVDNFNALLGQNSMQRALPSQRSHVMTVFSLV